MLSDTELDSMRAMSLSALPDTGTVTRAAASGTLDAGTGEWTPAAATTVYTGLMRVRPPTITDLTILFGDEHLGQQRYVATLPHDVADIALDDRVVVTAATDPTISGRTFRVVAVSTGSFHIDRRLGLEVVE